MESQSQSSGRRHREQSSSASPSSRRSLKRKLEEDSGNDRGSVGAESPATSQQDLMRDIRAQVEILDSVFSAAEQDRASAKRAIHVLSELAKNGTVTGTERRINFYFFYPLVWSNSPFCLV